MKPITMKTYGYFRLNRQDDNYVKDLLEGIHLAAQREQKQKQITELTARIDKFKQNLKK